MEFNRTVTGNYKLYYGNWKDKRDALFFATASVPRMIDVQLGNYILWWHTSQGYQTELKGRN